MWKIKVVVGHKKGVEPWVERDYPVGSVMYEERLWRSEEEGLELEDVDPKDFEIDGMLRLLNSEKIRSGYRYIWENIYTKARYPMFHTELKRGAERNNRRPKSVGLGGQNIQLGAQG